MNILFIISEAKKLVVCNIDSLHTLTYELHIITEWSQNMF